MFAQETFERRADVVGRRDRRVVPAVEEDEQTQEYVQMLEQEYDRRNDTAIPTAEDIGAAFERFLREQEDE